MDKSNRGNASQFFVAGELCRRGYCAVVTMGNTPNTDVLCSNKEGTKFVHIQVKTFIPGGKTCSVGEKAEKDYGPNFFWILAGIPLPDAGGAFKYFIIPAHEMSTNTKKAHQLWLETPGVKGLSHSNSKIRIVALPPGISFSGWDIKPFEERWDLIKDKLG